MIAYLDSSAIVKIFVEEAESAVLAQALRDWPDHVSSRVARVEVTRVARRLGGSAPDRAVETLAAFTLLPLDDETLEAAGRVAPAGLRALDSIHIASALSIEPELGTLISYDRRMLEASELAGLPAVAPR